MGRFRTLLLCVPLVALMGCEVEQTEEGELPDVDVDGAAGELPDVDVDVSGGELPEADVDVTGGDAPSFDVNWADVDVGTTTRTVQVPDVDVSTEQREVEVPVVDVNIPDGGEKAERTILVEAEVQDEMHDLTIEEIYAVNDQLLVLSRLEPTGEPLDEQSVQVADRLVLNAPDNLTIRHYIIGEPPAGNVNGDYTFIQSRTEIEDRLQNGRAIYTR